MHFLDSFIISPSANQLHLSSYIVLISLLIQLPFFSLLLGFSLFSVLFNLIGKRDQNPTLLRFSGLLSNAFLFNKYALILFGFIPVLSLYLSLSQFLFESHVNVSYFFAFLMPSLIISLVLVYIYHRLSKSNGANSTTPVLLGISSVAFLLLTSFLLISIIAFVINFERRFFNQNISQLLLSWNGVTRYLVFLSLTVAISGAGALLFFFDRLGGIRELDEDLRTLTREFGAGTIYAAIILTPVFTVLNFITLPDIAISVPVILLTLLFFLTLLSAFFIFQRAKEDYRALFTPVLFVALTASYSIATVNDVLSIENSTKEHVKYLISEAEKSRPVLTEAEKTSSENIAELEKKGELIFKNRCSACHKFDERLVGPPFLQVLPKYRDNKDKLISFILNPTKKNPGYPQMPNLGLVRKEVEAVTQYVLKRLDEESKM